MSSFGAFHQDMRACDLRYAPAVQVLRSYSMAKGSSFGTSMLGPYQVKPRICMPTDRLSGGSPHVRCRSARILLARGLPDPWAHEGSLSLDPSVQEICTMVCLLSSLGA
jgi:hypothetical protein